MVHALSVPGTDKMYTSAQNYTCTAYIGLHTLHTYITSYTYVRTYIHTYISTYIHTLHTYIRTYVHTCIRHTYIHTYILYIHYIVHVRTYIHTYTHTYIHTYIHTPISIHTHLHPYTHIHTRSADATVHPFIDTFVPDTVYLVDVSTDQFSLPQLRWPDGANLKSKLKNDESKSQIRNDKSNHFVLNHFEFGLFLIQIVSHLDSPFGFWIHSFSIWIRRLGFGFVVSNLDLGTGHILACTTKSNPCLKH